MNNRLIDSVKIAIVDDHLIKDLLADVINAYGPYKVTQLANNGKDLIDRLNEQNLPDLVILDVNMPIMDGFETTKWLHQHFPKILILILSMYGNEPTIERLVKLGARGYLKKDAHPAEVRTAIETIISAGNFLPGRTLASILSSTDENLKIPNKNGFSERELQFMQLVGSEKTYKQIAIEMKVKPRMVDHFRDCLFEKLEIKNRASLVRYAVNHGLIPVEDNDSYPSK
jgi:DNA-binding NarL/FixJ family response regulator